MRVSSSESDMPPYTAGSRRERTSRLTPLRTTTCTARLYSASACSLYHLHGGDPLLRGDQLVEGVAHVVRWDGDVPVGTVLAEEHEPSLLVTAERGPGTVAVDPDRAWIQHIFDDVRWAAREPERCQQAECDGVPVRHFLVAGRRLEGVRKGVPEVEDRAAASIERIAQAHRRFESGAGPDHRLVFEFPERTAHEQSRFDHFRHAFASLRRIQCRQHSRVGDDSTRIVECADEVLPGLKVDRGL